MFAATENLVGRPTPTAQAAEEAKAEAHAAAGLARSPVAEAFELIDRAFEAVVGDDGSCNLGDLGNALIKPGPPLDPMTHCKGKLGDLLEAFPGKFDLTRPPPRSPGTVLVRHKPPFNR